MAIPDLPPPAADQAYCDVSALEGGELVLPCAYFVTNAAKDEKVLAPALSFLLLHSRTKETLVFDLGVRKDLHNAVPPIIDRVSKFSPINIPQDVPESLTRGGLTPDEVTYVCLSHCHWDHTGNPALFAKSKFLVGGEARTLFQPGYPSDPKSLFATDLLPQGRTEFLDTAGWGPIGPFERSLDFFGDGSLYIIDAPGHLAGHINLLARTSPDGGWLYLAGDSAHDWRLIRRTAEMSGIRDEHGHVTGCAHVNKEVAEDTIRRIGDLMTLPRVKVIIAHDAEWFAQNKGGAAFWPGKIPSE